ncbi:MAG: carboxylating nicotinate-nucleotide diphosphorylase [Candidatus Hadarchaeales archaeon]
MDRKLIRQMLKEDVGKGDITSEILIGRKVRAKGKIITKQDGVLAGAEEASRIFAEVGVKSKILRKDGEEIKKGDVVMEVEGPARKILMAERMALNVLMRMSGIATATKKLLELARRKNPNIIIAATRKTAPLLLGLDKKAVMIGGGSTHRKNLSEMILIKDNHLKLVGSVELAVRKAKEAGKTPVEVEVTNIEDAVKAAEAGADIILLDNMSVEEVKEVTKLLKRKGLREKVKLEVSGGIGPENISDYAATGVDVISSSYMTMKAPAIDMSLEIE